MGMLSDKYLIPTNAKKECCLVAPNGNIYGLDWGEQDFMPHLDMVNAIVADGLFEPYEERKKLKLKGYDNTMSIMERAGWAIIRGDCIVRYPTVNFTNEQWETLVAYFKNNYEGFCHLNDAYGSYSITTLSGMEPLAFNELCAKTL
jgi:hypothetical protein